MSNFFSRPSLKVLFGSNLERGFDGRGSDPFVSRIRPSVCLTRATLSFLFCANLLLGDGINARVCSKLTLPDLVATIQSKHAMVGIEFGSLHLCMLRSLRTHHCNLMSSRCNYTTQHRIQKKLGTLRIFWSALHFHSASIMIFTGFF